MTKSQLIAALAQRMDITKSRAELVVNCIFDSMTSALEAHDRIEIRGFGTFSVKKHGAYHGRNPKTGELVEVPPKWSPHFKVGKELHELLNEGLAQAAQGDVSDPGSGEMTQPGSMAPSDG